MQSGAEHRRTLASRLGVSVADVTPRALSASKGVRGRRGADVEAGAPAFPPDEEEGIAHRPVGDDGNQLALGGGAGAGPSPWGVLGAVVCVSLVGLLLFAWSLETRDADGVAVPLHEGETEKSRVMANEMWRPHHAATEGGRWRGGGPRLDDAAAQQAWSRHEAWRPHADKWIDCSPAILARFGQPEGAGEGDWVDALAELMVENPDLASIHSEAGEDVFLMQHFFGHPVARFGTFVDVGAMDGRHHSNTMTFYASLGWTGLNIEPAPKNFEQLLVNRPDDSNFNSAICMEPGRALIYGNGASANHDKDHGRSQRQRPRGAYSVSCGPLSTFIEKGVHFTHVDLLSVDSGGEELTTIRTYPWHRVPLLVAIVELVEKKEHQNEVVRQELKDQGMCRVAWGIGHSSEVFVNATRFAQQNPFAGWPGPLGRIADHEVDMKARGGPALRANGPY